MGVAGVLGVSLVLVGVGLASLGVVLSPLGGSILVLAGVSVPSSGVFGLGTATTCGVNAAGGGGSVGGGGGTLGLGVIVGESKTYMSSLPLHGPATIERDSSVTRISKRAAWVLDPDVFMASPFGPGHARPLGRVDVVRSEVRSWIFPSLRLDSLPSGLLAVHGKGLLYPSGRVRCQGGGSQSPRSCLGSKNGGLTWICGQRFCLSRVHQRGCQGAKFPISGACCLRLRGYCLLCRKFFWGPSFDFLCKAGQDVERVLLAV